MWFGKTNLQHAKNKAKMLELLIVSFHTKIKGVRLGQNVTFM